MITRRDAMAAALVLMSEAAARGQATPPVFKHELPNVSLDGWEVTVSHVNYAPAQASRAHRHAGFVLAYVVSGSIVTAISGQGEKTYTAGQMFYEPPGSTHQVSKNASSSEPALLLALIFAPKGATLTVPA
jgi:quercetin dioxygenase-like cupin family protein